jgi:hypothetical protein
LSTQTVMNDLN